MSRELYMELVGALRSAIAIIGHPDDIVTQAMVDIADRAEAEASGWMISYNHSGDPTVRFVQYAKDPVPVWATDVKPHFPA